MQKLKNICWEEVCKNWKENETQTGYWNHLIKEHGFSSWDEWRLSYASKLSLPQHNWELYSASYEDVPQFFCGAFYGWLQAAEEVGGRSFASLQKASVFQAHKKIDSIKKAFPQNTQIIACRKGDNIFVFEGNHRCLALSQMLREKKVQDGEIQIALTEFSPEKDYPYIDYFPRNKGF